MNCRHINKFMCNNINFKSFSSHSGVHPEQLYNCFQKNPQENLRSLKFVPKELAPKIPAEEYHDSAQQAKIARRIHTLQNQIPLGAKESHLLTTRLQVLLQTGQPSLMNFSTKSIVKSRSKKSVYRRPSSSNSNNYNNFHSGSRSLLNRFKLTAADVMQRRFRSTYAAQKSMETDERDLENMEMNTEAVNKMEASKAREIESKDVAAAAEESLALAFNIRAKLEDLSTRIRRDLMKIDGSLKEKISLIKRKIDKGITHTSQLTQAEGISFPEEGHKQTYHTDLELMPMLLKRSTLSILNEHSKSLSFDPKGSILVRQPNTAGMIRLKREMTGVDEPGDGRFHTQSTSEPFEVKGELMDIEIKRDRGTTNIPNEDHIVGISYKNAADADGVYFAPRRAKKQFFSR